MKLWIIIFVSVFFACLLLLIHPVHAATTPEIKFVKSTMTRLILADQNKVSQESELVKKLFALFEFDLFANKTTIDFNKKLSAKEYKEFKEVFSKLMLHNMVRNASRISGKKAKKVQYHLKQKSPKESVVSVAGQAEHGDFKMEFTVSKPNKAWRITDISIEGVLLSRNYRGQFNRIFREEGLKGLTSRMRKKIASL